MWNADEVKSSNSKSKDGNYLVWNKLNKDNVKELADMSLFRRDYMNMHGFEIDGIDYSEDVQI